jgi:hypothetical protein
VPLRYQLLRQPRDNTFCATIPLRRHCFRKRRNLGNAHKISPRKPAAVSPIRVKPCWTAWVPWPHSILLLSTSRVAATALQHPSRCCPSHAGALPRGVVDPSSDPTCGAAAFGCPSPLFPAARAFIGLARQGPILRQSAARACGEQDRRAKDEPPPPARRTRLSLSFAGGGGVPPPARKRATGAASA